MNKIKKNLNNILNMKLNEQQKHSSCIMASIISRQKFNTQQAYTTPSTNPNTILREPFFTFYQCLLYNHVSRLLKGHLFSNAFG